MASRRHVVAKSPPVGRPNSIGLGERDLARLLDEVDRESSTDAVKRRKFVRWPYRRTIKMSLKQVGGGTPVELNLACRNLSSGGAGLLHSSYVYEGSVVELQLPATNGQIVAVKGEVVHCRHVRGTTHEIGVRFDQTINPRSFLTLDAFADSFTLEHVDPAQLEGCVLAIDDSEMDLRIIQHYLKGTMIKFRTAETIEEGLEKAAEGCDLILCDFMIGDRKGTEFVAKLRETGSRTPVVIVTADQTMTTREHLLLSQVDAFLAKPVAREVLLRAIAEFMIVGGGPSEALKSTLPNGHPNLALLPEFTKDLTKIAGKLEETIETDDYGTCRQLCLRISGTGPSLGFGSLAACADRVATMVSASMSTKESSAEISSLVNLIRRVAA